MYDYTEFDEAFVRERVAQFRGQVQRRIDGALSEEEFRIFGKQKRKTRYAHYPRWVMMQISMGKLTRRYLVRIQTTP